MHLESARALKQEILERVFEPLTAAERIIALAAGSLPPRRLPQRLLSIGIAPAGRTNMRIAVRVQRRALEQGPELAKIRRLARDEVDLRYVGRIQKRAAPWQRRRQRPLVIGCSVGHFQITAGTLGCFAVRRQEDTPLILSNNHVLADENRGKAGDAVIQPGAVDGGRKTRDTVARLADFVPLRPRAVNHVDAALASLRATVPYRPGSIRGLGKLTGVAPPLEDLRIRVAKLGRTTGLTRGRITAFELDDVVVAYETGNLRFDDQIEIEGEGPGPFSDGGDSGSLIVNEAGEGVALLFAGSDQGGRNGAGLTYANPLPTVFERLKIDLLL